MRSRLADSGNIIILALVLICAATTTSTARAAGFIENRGQYDKRALYVLPGHLLTVHAGARELVFDLHEALPPSDAGVDVDVADLLDHEPPESGNGWVVRLRFPGAAPSAVEASAPLPYPTHFLLGEDPAGWRTYVRTYRQIVYRDLWPGVNLVLRVEEGRLHYEWRLEPGTNPAVISLAWDGARSVRRERDRVIVATDMGDLVGIAPAVTQSGGVLALRHDETGAAGPTDKDDPSQLLWSTYLGYPDDEITYAMILDDQDRPIIAGWGDSVEYPTTSGAYQVNLAGHMDIYVTKLLADGTGLVWSTWIGGPEYEYAQAIAFDSAQNIFLGGRSRSGGSPITPGAYADTQRGGGDGYLAKLSADGSTLIWATYIGSSDLDKIYGLAVDQQDRPVIVGRVVGDDWPTTAGAYDETGAPFGTYVTKFTADGTGLVWSTVMDDATYHGIVMDDLDQPTVTGVGSASYPTTAGAYRQTCADGGAVITKFSADGSALVWSTFYGVARGNDIVLDPLGNPVITGYTNSDTLPMTPQAYQPTLATGIGYAVDGFIAKLDASGSNLLAATYLGGSYVDLGLRVRTDPLGTIHVASFTGSQDFPVTPDGYDTSWNGGWDATYNHFDPALSYLYRGTYLGGESNDNLQAFALDGGGNPLLAGTTESEHFPVTPGAYDTTPGVSDYSYDDTFVSKLAGAVVSPECLVMPDQLAFGPVLVGEHRDEIFTITNTGTVMLDGEVSEACEGFELVAGAGAYSLAPGQAHEVTVRFAPTAGGPQVCEIQTGNAACSNANCSGEGIDDADCWPDPLELHFGVVWVNEVRVLDLWLRNTGSAALDLHIDLDDPGGSYVILSGGGDVTLGVGEQHLIQVEFGPVEVGLHLATIHLGNAACGDIECEGTGAETLPTGTEDVPLDRPLLRIWPNPFNPRAMVIFNLPEAGHALITVHDVAGRLVARLEDAMVAGGPHVLRWEGRDGDGRSLPSGVYFVRLRGPGVTLLQKVMLLR